MKTPVYFAAGLGLVGLAAWLWWRQSRQASTASDSTLTSPDFSLPDLNLQGIFSGSFTGGQDFLSFAENMGTLNAPRGIRNNNPGNIRKDGTPWVGLAPADQQTDPDFFVFSEGKYGIRAIARILLNKQARGLVTVRQMISGNGGWAPTGTADQNPATYANFVAQEMGVDVDQAVTLAAQLPLLESMVAAVIQFENGQQPYAGSYIETAVQL